MTDNEIIKALECCKGADTDCWECELFDSCKFTVQEIMQNALDLINRQKAKIEALQMDNSQLQSDVIIANQNYEHMKGLFEQSQRVKKRAIERFLSTYKVLETARAEFERLKGRLESSDKQLEEMKEGNGRLYLRFNTAKSEAVKEFAESVDKIVTTRLKYYLEINEEKGVVYIPKFIIEKILEELKEMVGDEE